MSTFNGLPAHALLVHFIVVLAPLTAVLAILCAVWPAARQRLVWLVVALSLLTAALTPLTTEAGEWLQHRVGRSPTVHTHAELGDTMIFFALALLVAAALLAVVHVRAGRGRSLSNGAVGRRRGFRGGGRRRDHRAGVSHRRLGSQGHLGSGGVGAARTEELGLNFSLLLRPVPRRHRRLD